MKIVDFKTFISLPPGTIFSFYQPEACDDLCRLYTPVGETDFYYASLIAGHWGAEPLTCDTDSVRWGLYEFEQLFAVYEAADIAMIQSQLPSGETQAAIDAALIGQVNQKL